MNIVIRTAGVEDAAELARLAGQLGYPCTPSEVASRLALESADTNRLVIVAESHQAMVVGWLAAETSGHFFAVPDVVISGLVVDEAIRGSGVGKALLARAEEWTKGKGMPRIRLRSSLKRTEAHEFYKHLGYSISKQQYAFVKELR